MVGCGDGICSDIKGGDYQQCCELQVKLSIVVSAPVFTLIMITPIVSVMSSMFAGINDLTKGWQNLNLLSHPNATLVPQVRQSRASGENLNYVKLAPQARQADCEVAELLV